MNSVKNFRELAFGLRNKKEQRIKSNMIYRSGELSGLDEADAISIKHLGIKRIYDLRSTYERNHSVTNLDIEIKHFNVSNSNSDNQMNREFLENIAKNGAENFMILLYQEYLPFSPVLKPLMQEIVIEKDPFLFHCAAGKDRTGVTGALIMQLLDFEEKAIIDEYVTLDPRVLMHAEESQRNTDKLPEALIRSLEPLNGVKQIFIESFFNAILERYESINHYVHQFLGLNDDQIKHFKNNYLTTEKTKL